MTKNVPIVPEAVGIIAAILSIGPMLHTLFAWSSAFPSMWDSTLGLVLIGPYFAGVAFILILFMAGSFALTTFVTERTIMYATS